MNYKAMTALGLALGVLVSASWTEAAVKKIAPPSKKYVVSTGPKIIKITP